VAFSPQPDTPHPLRVSGQQQTGLFHIPIHTAKVEDQCVLDLTAGTGLQSFGLRLHPGKGMFDHSVNPPKFTIAFVLSRTQWAVAIRLVLNTIEPTKFPRHDLNAIIGVAFIPEQSLCFQIGQGFGIVAVMLIGRGEGVFVDQLAFRIQSNMAFIPKIVSAALLGRAGIGVQLRVVGCLLTALLLLGHRAVGRFDHRGINDTALAYKQAIFTELTVYFFEQAIGQTGFGQLILKLPEAGEVRSFVAKGEPDKMLKTQPVIEMLFKLWITQAIKMLQKQRFNHHLGVMAGTPAFTCSALIQFVDNLNQWFPVDDTLHFLQERSSSCILLFRVEELVGEGALIVFLNHNFKVSYWYLSSYKIQKIKIIEK